MIKIAVARGDGIGPEIMDSALRIIKKADPSIEFIEFPAGEEFYKSGNSCGIPDESWKIIEDVKVLLKSPITTPQGRGCKSLNVTLRKRLELHANIRPCTSFNFIDGNKKIDVVIFRENSEDLYVGMEYRQTYDSCHALKIISRLSCARICINAFEYARANDRKKITCLVKDNIMKVSDGLFSEVFRDVAKDYPDIRSEICIVDIGIARLASRPEDFDVVVTSNLYGDIASDVVAEISGSVGMCGSANVGDKFAMFEAVHGSAPDIAGKNIANPCGLLNASIMMFEYLCKYDAADKIKFALKKTFDDGIFTGDIYAKALDDFKSKEIGTKEFADEVIKRIDDNVTAHASRSCARDIAAKKIVEYKKAMTLKKVPRKLVGVDLFVDLSEEMDIEKVAYKIKERAINHKLKLDSASSQGLKIWPRNGNMCEDIRMENINLRFICNDGIDYNEIMKIFQKLHDMKIIILKSENLYSYESVLGYSLHQGE